MSDPLIKMIPAINACDFPQKVDDWCTDQDISTHYEHTLCQIPNDGNPMVKWLKRNGVSSKEEYFWIGIWGT